MVKRQPSKLCTKEAPTRVAIGLGSSLGDRAHHLKLALRLLAMSPGLQLMRVSRSYQSPPMRGGAARGWFLNAVALFESTIPPSEILRLCIRIEDRAGRRRVAHWGDRTLDLDVLHVEGLVSEERSLRLPHPGLATRSFVLRPLSDVWPDASDPITGLVWSQLSDASRPRAVPLRGLALR